MDGFGGCRYSASQDLTASGCLSPRARIPTPAGRGLARSDSPTKHSPKNGPHLQAPLTIDGTRNVDCCKIRTSMYRLGRYTQLTCSCSRGRSHSEAACRPIPLAAPDRLTAPPSITPASRCSCSARNGPKTQISRLCGSNFTAEMASTHHTRLRWGLNAAPPHHCRPPISDLRRRDKSPASVPQGDVGSATRAPVGLEG